MREFIFHWIPPLMVRGSRDIEREERAKAPAEALRGKGKRKARALTRCPGFFLVT